MTKEDKDIMVDEELDDFYADQEEADKKFKLLLEFKSSKYKYKGMEFEIPKKTSKEITKGKKIDLSKRKRKGNKLF